MIATLLLGACGPTSADPAFESANLQVIDCFSPAPAGSECVLVTAPVVGSRRGTGSCQVLAAGPTGNLSVAAATGEMEIEPGDTIRWTAIVARSDDASFTGWNPVCEPMIEG